MILNYEQCIKIFVCLKPYIQYCMYYVSLKRVLKERGRVFLGIYYTVLYTVYNTPSFSFKRMQKRLFLTFLTAFSCLVEKYAFSAEQQLTKRIKLVFVHISKCLHHLFDLSFRYLFYAIHI